MNDSLRWTRPLQPLACAFVAVLVAACGSSANGDDGRGSDADPGGNAGGSETSTPPPDDCYVRAVGSSDPQKCADESDCGAGGRCDKALSPPQCVQLYCLPPGAACSDDVQCKSGTRCAASQCAPCTMCGSQCVFLMNDPANCGACGNPVVTGDQCFDGRSACNDLSPDSVPVVPWTCRTDATSFVAPKASGHVADGTYVLTTANEWTSSKDCTGEAQGDFQWIVRVTGESWDLARIDSLDGKTQTAAGSAVYVYRSSIDFEASCDHFVSPVDGTPWGTGVEWDYELVDGGGFRIVLGSSMPITEYIFMPK
jgi:hypothetical protein